MKTLMYYINCRKITSNITDTMPHGRRHGAGLLEIQRKSDRYKTHRDDEDGKVII